MILNYSDIATIQNEIYLYAYQILMWGKICRSTTSKAETIQIFIQLILNFKSEKSNMKIPETHITNDC